MFALLGLAMFGLAAMVVAKMVIDDVTGRVRLFSVRNVFLAGFCIFQLVSGGYTLAVERWHRFPLSESIATPAIFLGYCAAFLVVLFLAYNWRGPHLKAIGRRLPAFESPNDSKLMVIAVVLTILAAGLRVVPIPLVGVLSMLLAVGLAATSAAIAGWVWVHRPFNPTIIVIAFAIFLINWALMSVGFGRRNEVTVLIAAIWGAYYGGLYRLPLHKSFLPLVILLIPSMMLISAVTSTRAVAREREVGALDQVMLIIQQGDPTRSFEELAHGQGAAHISMWAIENFPEAHPHGYLHSLFGVFVHPVPRDMWPEKPIGLGQQFVSQANLRGVQHGDYTSAGFTVGTGLLGAAHHDGGFPAVLLYAVLLGAMLRALDEVVATRPNRALLVLPASAALGQVIGIPRGEVSLFVFNFLFTTVTTYAVVFVVAAMFSVRIRRGEDDAAPHPMFEADTATQPEDPNWAALA